MKTCIVGWSCGKFAKEMERDTGWNTRSSDQILWLLLIGRQVKLPRWHGGTPASALSIAGFIHHRERGKKGHEHIPTITRLYANDHTTKIRKTHQTNLNQYRSYRNPKLDRKVGIWKYEVPWYTILSHLLGNYYRYLYTTVILQFSRHGRTQEEAPGELFGRLRKTPAPGQIFHGHRNADLWWFNGTSMDLYKWEKIGSDHRFHMVWRGLTWLIFSGIHWYTFIGSCFWFGGNPNRCVPRKWWKPI